jgi:ketosteroid isomerase-like protein
MSVTSADDESRGVYAAVASRDFATMESCFTPDAVWHLPGKSPITGDRYGRAAIRDGFFARLRPRSGQTFQAELLDVTAGQTFVVAVEHATATIGFRPGPLTCEAGPRHSAALSLGEPLQAADTNLLTAGRSLSRAAGGGALP